VELPQRPPEDRSSSPLWNVSFHVRDCTVP